MNSHTSHQTNLKGLKKIYLTFALFFIASNINARTAYLGRDSLPKDSLLNIYRAAAPKINDLIHTKLDVRFDYQKHYLYGKEWVKIRPHFYSTDSLTLDAKEMDIHSIALVEGALKHPLKFTYQNEQLKINLGKLFNRHETYTIYIDYTAKPDEVKQKGSAAINSAKGLFFINSDGKDSNKPIQIWTQGETESSSCWFPTIDKPDQKTTDEISMTVPSKYVTLSNGRLVYQKTNSDGTRTDTWKMDLPHCPYLFMMAVGDFKITHDSWKNKEVNYYLESKYAPYAKAIFGNTPKMMSFYAKITGIDFPWNKYDQIVVRDYVSGAMENTTATLHGEYVQKTDRELLDGDEETTICHELFHQWFGDYVTCESWSNITLNESFATLSEILWTGYQKGKDAEDAERFDKLHSYLMGTHNGISAPLVRYHYKDREEVFDNVSYPKGSVILYALKNLIGDDAFFQGLNLYLKTNAFQSADASQLRTALEKVSGIDLNEYFNRWYYRGGHPILDFNSEFNKGVLTLHVKQTQDSSMGYFKIPMKLCFYLGNQPIMKDIALDAKANQVFRFPLTSNPNLIDYDVNKILVGELKDHKTIEEFAFSYSHAPSYFNRKEAIEACLEDQTNTLSLEVLKKALRDSSPVLRKEVVAGLKVKLTTSWSQLEPQILSMANMDPKTTVRAACISKLTETENVKYLDVCREGIKNKSYAIIGASLQGILSMDEVNGKKLLMNMDSETKNHILETISDYYSKKGEDDNANFFEQIFKSNNQQKVFQVFRNYLTYLSVNTNPRVSKQGVGNILEFTKNLNDPETSANISGSLSALAHAKKEKANLEILDLNKKNLLEQAEIFDKGAKDLLK